MSSYGSGLQIMTKKYFPNPDRFDISRSPHGHSHVGFGNGIHFCLGAPLARLEGKIALKVILERLKDLQFEYEQDSDLAEGLPQNIQPLRSLFFHGVSSLPLKFSQNGPARAKRRLGNYDYGTSNLGIEIVIMDADRCLISTLYYNEVMR